MRDRKSRDYSEGKIYKLEGTDRETRRLLTYVGATCDDLPKRLYGHKYNKNGCKSKIILENCDDYKMVLLEEVKCENKYQLQMKEYEWIDKLDCVNFITGKYQRAGIINKEAKNEAKRIRISEDDFYRGKINEAKRLRYNTDTEYRERHNKSMRERGMFRYYNVAGVRERQVERVNNRHKRIKLLRDLLIQEQEDENAEFDLMRSGYATS